MDPALNIMNFFLSLFKFSFFSFETGKITSLSTPRTVKLVHFKKKKKGGTVKLLKPWMVGHRTGNYNETNKLGREKYTSRSKAYYHEFENFWRNSNLKWTNHKKNPTNTIILIVKIFKKKYWIYPSFLNGTDGNNMWKWEKNA